MRPSLAVILALALAAPSAALAAEPKPALGQYVDISPVAAPIVVDGRLINYVFVTVRLVLAPSANAQALRDREPFFRDALVRAAHRTPFVRASDYTKIDEAALKSTMMREGGRIAGRPGVMIGVTILNAQPQRITGLPRPGAAPEPRAPIP